MNPVDELIRLMRRSPYRQAQDKRAEAGSADRIDAAEAKRARRRARNRQVEEG